MKKYRVDQLAKLAGVSVRTLHYYDSIDLLKPAGRSQSDYRYYGKQELLRLQQILFYKELDVPLAQIKDILDDPDFDVVESLKQHRKQLVQRIDTSKNLLNTLDKTLTSLTQNTMITDAEMYEGFSPEKIAEYRKEVTERWGSDALAATENNIKKMSPEQFKRIKAEGNDILKKLAQLMQDDPASSAVQTLIGDYHDHLCNFYPVSTERYRCLGQMYVDDERFTAYYEKFAPGLAQFINKAIQVYCS